jgi:hypothetical protein
MEADRRGGVARSCAIESIATPLRPSILAETMKLEAIERILFTSARMHSSRPERRSR